MKLIIKDLAEFRGHAQKHEFNKSMHKKTSHRWLRGGFKFIEV